MQAIANILYQPQTAASWQNQIEALPGILPLTKDTLSFLPRILSRYTSPDPYMVCPSYHAFTGRYGLWAYYKGKSLLLMARNPAKQDEILVFPQLGEQVPHLIQDILTAVSPPAGGYRLARYPAEQADFVAAVLNKRTPHYSFEVITEDILDWTYPVHVIDTETVTNPAGRKMKSFRHHLAEIDQSRITVKPFNSEGDIPELMSIVDKWARSKAGAVDYNEMMEVYGGLFDLVLHPALSLKGIKIYYDGILRAYEIWDMPKEPNGTANSFAGFSDAEISGFSEFQHYALCKALLDHGIRHVCLGGSEIEGLDRFKRKMNPVRSIALKSIVIKPQAHLHATVSA